MSTPEKVSRSRQRIRQYLAALGRQADAVLTAPAPLVRATLFTARRGCGKPGCRCQRGRRHQRLVLAVRQAGQSREVATADLDHPRLRRAVECYRTFRRSRAELVKIFRQLLDEIDILRRLQEVPVDGLRRKGGQT
jgi:hypothetical protein